MPKLASKGKWIPGTRETHLYSCDTCDRGFFTQGNLDKHLTTELHFKRSARALSSSMSANDFDLFLEQNDCPRRSGRESRTAKHLFGYTDNQKAKSPSPLPSSRSSTTSARTTSKKLDSNYESCTHTRCPTCFSKVDKKQMGKHLISHFHCQFHKTRNSRLMNPELNLILDHIHDIVVQSPYQCATCKFYFTHKEQLVAHFRQHHLEHPSTTQEGWNCSACCRSKFARSGEALLEHLNSSCHRIMEAAIAMSIPIIVKQVTLQVCPLRGCSKTFILNRELVSHIKDSHVKESSTLIRTYSLNSATLQTEVIEPTTSSCRPEFTASKSDCSLYKTDKGTKHLTQTYANEIVRCSDESKSWMNGWSQKELDLEHHSFCENPPSDQSIPPQNNYAKEANSTKSSTRSSSNLDEPDTNLACQLRDFKVPKSSSLKLKMEKVQYKCELCNHTTHKRAFHTRHIQTHDTKRVKSFHCSECSSSFYDKYALTKHKKIHEGKLIKCTFESCSYVGKTNYELNSHLLVHNSSYLYSCNLCKYSSKIKRNLTRHQFHVHSIGRSLDSSQPDGFGKPFKCTKCTFQTNTANGLKRHLLQHSQDCPFHCPYCTLQTKNIENLRVHVLKRQVHPGKSLYCCNLCVKPGGKIVRGVSAYKTNKFLDFRSHVIEEHSSHPHSKTQKGLFVIAGIQKSSIELATHNSQNDVTTNHESEKLGTQSMESQTELSGELFTADKPTSPVGSQTSLNEEEITIVVGGTMQDSSCIISQATIDQGSEEPEATIVSNSPPLKVNYGFCVDVENMSQYILLDDENVFGIEGL